MFTTPEGETVEVVGIVEEEASSATSLAKTGEATKGSSKSINLVKSGAGKTLKEFDSTLLERYDGHIFSVKHGEYGIMKLGSSKEAIKKIFLKKILEADALGKLQNNVLNQIVTEINGYETVIKVFIKKGKAISVDGYILNKKLRILGNTFRL